MTGVQTCALPICFPVTIGEEIRNLAELSRRVDEVEGEESESEEKPRDQKADSGNETEALEDQAGEGKLDLAGGLG